MPAPTGRGQVSGLLGKMKLEDVKEALCLAVDTGVTSSSHKINASYLLLSWINSIRACVLSQSSSRYPSVMDSNVCVFSRTCAVVIYFFLLLLLLAY